MNMSEISRPRLEEALRLHEAFIHNKPGGVRADLSGADLSGIVRSEENPAGVDLQNAKIGITILRGADLHGADLRGTIFYKADLREANFDGCNLKGAILVCANLAGATIRGAILDEARLDKVTARGAVFTRASIQKASLRDADFRDADFWRCDLFRTKLTRSNLQGADLSRTNLLGATVWEADLRGARLDRASWPMWCGALNVKVDRKFAATLAYLFCRLDCDDPDFLFARLALAPFANTFERCRIVPGERTEEQVDPV